MRNTIIKRIQKIQAEEDNFKTESWEDNFVSFELNGTLVARHISEVNFEMLPDEDLVGLFEYIILCRDGNSHKRVEESVFKIRNLIKLM